VGGWESQQSNQGGGCSSNLILGVSSVVSLSYSANTGTITINENLGWTYITYPGGAIGQKSCLNAARPGSRDGTLSGNKLCLLPGEGTNRRLPKQRQEAEDTLARKNVGRRRLRSKGRFSTRTE